MLEAEGWRCRQASSCRPGAADLRLPQDSSWIRRGRDPWRRSERARQVLARKPGQARPQPPGFLGESARKPCAGVVEPRNIFRHKSLALGRASGAESGVDHSSVDGRAMLQSVKKKLVSCRDPGRRARPGPRRSAGRPVAAARAERRSASLLALLSSSSTRSLACEARSLAVCSPLRRHPRPHALWLVGPLPLLHAVASAQPPPTPALSLEFRRSPHRRLAHARLTARLHLLPNRAAPRTPRGPRLPSRLLRLPSRPRPLPRGARAARAPSPAVRALVGPSRW